MKDNKYLTLREFKDIKERFQDCIARQEKLMARCMVILNQLQKNDVDDILYCCIIDLKKAIQDEFKRDFL